MNVYKFNIARYLSQTKDIGPADDLVYRRLIDLYYIVEGPIAGDAARIASLVEYDVDVVEGVLEAFLLLRLMASGLTPTWTPPSQNTKIRKERSWAGRVKSLADAP
jgi:hypothetical protein